MKGSRSGTAPLAPCLSVAPGEVLGYLGPNGSGKTTTVNIVLGLAEPSGGRVTFQGADIADDPVDFRRHVGYVPEQPNLYPYLSGHEYLELVADLRDMDVRVSRRRIGALIEVFGLDTSAHVALSSYSKGMRQKILIAAALLHNPPLLVFDEPVSGLDATSALVFRHLLEALAALRWAPPVAGSRVSCSAKASGPWSKV